MSQSRIKYLEIQKLLEVMVSKKKKLSDSMHKCWYSNPEFIMIHSSFKNTDTYYFTNTACNDSVVVLTWLAARHPPSRSFTLPNQQGEGIT